MDIGFFVLGYVVDDETGERGIPPSAEEEAISIACPFFAAVDGQGFAAEVFGCCLVFGQVGVGVGAELVGEDAGAVGVVGGKVGVAEVEVGEGAVEEGGDLGARVSAVFVGGLPYDDLILGGRNLHVLVIACRGSQYKA